MRSPLLHHLHHRCSSIRFAPAIIALLCGLTAVDDAAALQAVTRFDPGAQGYLEPVGPQIDDGVNAAQDFTVHSPSPTSVGLRWFNKGAPRTEISRSVNGGPWASIQSLGPLPENEYALFLDEGATANAENCYVIRVWDGVNSGSSLSTPQRCQFTRDGRDLPVHRLQLRLRVPHVSDAGTDNGVEVRLQSPSWLVPAVTNWRPAGNRTWVDSTFDDLEQGSNRTYDLMLDNVQQASDITMITLAKTGDDDLCIAELELLIDGQPAFQNTFGDTDATCKWVTDNDPFTVTFSELRASPTWNNLGLPTFTGFNGAALRSRIEATFGHWLHGVGALRNGSLTTSQRVNESRLSMSVPIVVYDVSWGPVYLGDVDSTVYFDLVLKQEVDGAGNPVTKLAIENVDADSSDLLAVFVPIVSPILYGVSTEIESQVSDFDPVTLPPSPLSGTHVCFSDDGGIGVCFDTSARQVRAPSSALQRTLQ